MIFGQEPWVSIHASVKDATTVASSMQLPMCFNPRVREGRDGRGAHLPQWRLCFNPRVREGRDVNYALRRLTP